MVNYLTNDRPTKVKSREILCDLGGFRISSLPLYTNGYRTASGTGTGSGIQPCIQLKCEPIADRILLLCYVVGRSVNFAIRAKEKG